MPPPKPGEVRTHNGETRVFGDNGKWGAPQVSTPVNPDEADGWYSGATRHFMEKEPGARNAILGGLAMLTRNPQIVASAPFVGTGLSRLSQMLDTGKMPDLPSGWEIAGDAVEGLVGGYGGHAIEAVGKGAGRIGGAAREVASQYQPLAGAIDKMMNWKTRALLSKPVTNFVEKLGTNLTPESIGNSFRSVLRGLTPGAEDTAGDAARAARASLGKVDRYNPSQSGYVRPPNAPPVVPRSRIPYAEPSPVQPAVGADPYTPNTSGYDPAAPSYAEPITKTPPPDPSFDPHTPNTSGYDPAAPSYADDAEKILPPDPTFDPHTPNTSGYDPANPSFADDADTIGPPDPSFDPYTPNTSGYDPPHSGFAPDADIAPPSSLVPDPYTPSRSGYNADAPFYADDIEKIGPPPVDAPPIETVDPEIDAAVQGLRGESAGPAGPVETPAPVVDPPAPVDAPVADLGPGPGPDLGPVDDMPQSFSDAVDQQSADAYEALKRGENPFDDWMTDDGTKRVSGGKRRTADRAMSKARGYTPEGTDPDPANYMPQDPADRLGALMGDYVGSTQPRGSFQPTPYGTFNPDVSDMIDNPLAPVRLPRRRYT